MENVDKIHLLELISDAVDRFNVDYDIGTCNNCGAKRPWYPANFELSTRWVETPSRTNEGAYGRDERYVKIIGWTWVGENWVEFTVYRKNGQTQRTLWCPSCASMKLGPEALGKE